MLNIEVRKRFFNVFCNKMMAMTFGRVLFAAHYSNCLLLGKFHEPFCAFLKPGTSHDFGVIDQVEVISTLARKHVISITSKIRGTSSKIVPRICIFNIPGTEFAFQGIPVELRIVAAIWSTTHIYQQANTVFF